MSFDLEDFRRELNNSLMCNHFDKTPVDYVVLFCNQQTYIDFITQYRNMGLWCLYSNPVTYQENTGVNIYGKGVRFFITELAERWWVRFFDNYGLESFNISQIMHQTDCLPINRKSIFRALHTEDYVQIEKRKDTGDFQLTPIAPVFGQTSVYCMTPEKMKIALDDTCDTICKRMRDVLRSTGLYGELNTHYTMWTNVITQEVIDFVTFQRVVGQYDIYIDDDCPVVVPTQHDIEL
jgi:hypothetical protein